MDNLTPEINFSLTFFLIVSGVFIIIGGTFLSKILIELSSLIHSFDKFVELVNYEFVPTIREVQKTLKHVSNISDKADKHVTQLSDGIDRATESSSSAVQKARVNLSSILTGLAEGLKRFTSHKN